MGMWIDLLRTLDPASPEPWRSNGAETLGRTYDDKENS